MLCSRPAPLPTPRHQPVPHGDPHPKALFRPAPLRTPPGSPRRSPRAAHGCPRGFRSWRSALPACRALLDLHSHAPISAPPAHTQWYHPRARSGPSAICIAPPPPHLHPRALLSAPAAPAQPGRPAANPPIPAPRAAPAAERTHGVTTTRFIHPVPRSPAASRTSAPGRGHGPAACRRWVPHSAMLSAAVTAPSTLQKSGTGKAPCKVNTVRSPPPSQPPPVHLQPPAPTCRRHL